MSSYVTFGLKKTLLESLKGRRSKKNKRRRRSDETSEGAEGEADDGGCYRVSFASSVPPHNPKTRTTTDCQKVKQRNPRPLFKRKSEPQQPHFEVAAHVGCRVRDLTAEANIFSSSLLTETVHTVIADSAGRSITTRVCNTVLSEYTLRVGCPSSETQLLQLRLPSEGFQQLGQRTVWGWVHIRSFSPGLVCGCVPITPADGRGLVEVGLGVRAHCRNSDLGDQGFVSRLAFSARSCRVGTMSQSGKGLDWADQWDPHYEDTKPNELEKKNASKTSSKEKMDKAKAAASVGMQKTKVAATVGMEKTKVVATVGAQKLKAGTTASFKWIKEKVQKKPQ